jgi:hypothetical protein
MLQIDVTQQKCRLHSVLEITNIKLSCKMKRLASELTRMRPALQPEHNAVSSPV